MERTKKNPIEDQRKQALEHYEDVSKKACHWSSFVKDAILAYNPDSAPSQVDGYQPTDKLDTSNPPRQSIPSPSKSEEEEVFFAEHFKLDTETDQIIYLDKMPLSKLFAQVRNKAIDECIDEVSKLVLKYFGLKNDMQIYMLDSEEIKDELSKLKQP